MQDVSPRAPESFPLIVVGGSAGAIPVVNDLLKGLPRTLNAAILIVIHQGQSSPGFLPAVICRHTAYPAAHARDGEPIQPGRVYVVPVDHHLLVVRQSDGSIFNRLSHGPKENRFRPAIDPLFRTAARARGRQTIGIILSGLLDDGTLGLMRVKSLGGKTVVQDPDDAHCRDMPASALRYMDVDYVVKADQLADIVERLVAELTASAAQDRSGATPMSDSTAPENDIPSAPRKDPDKFLPDTLAGPEHASVDVTLRGDAALSNETLSGSPSGLTCPSCGGAVWEQQDGSLIHFRCHVGHRYTADSFSAEQSNLLESTLWAALRMFEEKKAFNKRMLEVAEGQKDAGLAARFRERLTECGTHSEVIRRLLLEEQQREGEEGSGPASGLPGPRQ